MKSSRRIVRSLLIALLLLALLAGIAMWFRTPLILKLAERAAANRLSHDLLNELPDGLHVAVCGAGSPFPDERRSGPCTAVIAGKRLFIFDAGSGSARNISKLTLNAGRVEAIFLTHFHSDHFDGLGELLLQRWVSTANAQPVPVYGPQGVEAIVSGLAQAYSADRQYRMAHHGEQALPGAGFGGSAKPFAMTTEPQVILRDADLEIAAFAVDHAPVQPAVGYRIRYKGRSVVISGDTKKSPGLQAAAQGADVLIHEALSPRLVMALSDAAGQAGRMNLKKIFTDIIDYHATPEQAAETARDAKVAYLLLNHIAPPLPVPGMEAVFLGDAAALFSGPIRVALDGDILVLPAATKEIRLQRGF